MTDSWLTLFICGLATFRLSVMLSNDDGPGKIFSKLRSALKREAKQNPTLRKSDIHNGIDCSRCSSVWVALPMALYGFQHESLHAWITETGDVFLSWMALSGLAILFNRMFPKR